MRENVLAVPQLPCIPSHWKLPSCCTGGLRPGRRGCHLIAHSPHTCCSLQKLSFCALYSLLIFFLKIRAKTPLLLFDTPASSVLDGCLSAVFQTALSNTTCPQTRAMLTPATVRGLGEGGDCLCLSVLCLSEGYSTYFVVNKQISGSLVNLFREDYEVQEEIQVWNP